ncbi:amidohydrolase family protein, partial [Candidatus Bathyarchaeota archaeon]|nr:amidohydrolase family protein [Candidatus Bathyarchaeota archaeon]
MLFDGKIVTVDDRDSIVEAVAIRDGRFVAVGGTDEVMALAGESTRVIDLKGKTAMPGIIDSHTHPGGIASRFMEVDCRAPPVRNIHEILGMLKAKAEELGPRNWVMGANFNDSKLEEKRHITRWELDEAVPDNPVFIVADTGHQALVNSLAFEVAGVTKDTPDPPGGELERNEDGLHTGLLYENAVGLIREH